MTVGPTTLERALELASSGDYTEISKIRSKLSSEGYAYKCGDQTSEHGAVTVGVLRVHIRVDRIGGIDPAIGVGVISGKLGEAGLGRSAEQLGKNRFALRGASRGR